MTLPIFLHQGDIPQDHGLVGDIALDTETMGLNIYQRDRLCLVQISDGKTAVHLVQFHGDDYHKAVNLKALLADASRQVIMHFARFDYAAVAIFLGVEMPNIYCTKIASKLCRTYTDRHGLKELCKELLDIDLSKQQQSSFWGAVELSRAQQEYAASDVLYLHSIREKLDVMLASVRRVNMAKQCFDFLPTRVALDRAGWPEQDIFQH